MSSVTVFSVKGDIVKGDSDTGDCVPGECDKKHLHHVLCSLDVIRSAQDVEERRALADIALDQGDLGLGGPRDVRHDLTVFPNLKMTVTMQDNVDMEGGGNLPPQEASSGAPCR